MIIIIIIIIILIIDIIIIIEFLTSQLWLENIHLNWDVVIILLIIIIIIIIINIIIISFMQGTYTHIPETKYVPRDILIIIIIIIIMLLLLLVLLKVRFFSFTWNVQNIRYSRSPEFSVCIFSALMHQSNAGT